MSAIENIAVSNISEHEREVIVTLGEKAVKAEYDHAVQSVRNRAQRPGFRPGKMPLSMVVSLYDNDIKKIVSEQLVKKGLTEALESQKMLLVSEPILDEASEANPSKPFTFKAHFQVKPQISVEKYDGLNITVPKATFSEEDVAIGLEDIREMFATFKTPERKTVGENDKVSAKIIVKLKDDEVLVSQNDNAEIHLYSKVLPEETKKALLGKNIGDEASVEDVFPMESEEPEYRGKAFIVTMEVLGITERVLPNIDDELAKDFSPEFESLEALKDSIRKRLENTVNRRNEFNLKYAIKKALIDENLFSVPEGLVDRVAFTMVEKRLKELKKAEADDLVKKHWEEIWRSIRPQAEFQTKIELLLESLITKLKIEEKEHQAQIDEVFDIIKSSANINFIDEPIYKK